MLVFNAPALKVFFIFLFSLISLYTFVKFFIVNFNPLRINLVSFKSCYGKRQFALSHLWPATQSRSYIKSQSILLRDSSCFFIIFYFDYSFFTLCFSILILTIFSHIIHFSTSSFNSLFDFS